MVLKINNLSIGYYEDVILKDINLTISHNESVGIMGDNGSGKSTFLKAVMGISKIFSGKIIFNDKELNDLKPWERTIEGLLYIPQIGGLFPEMTVKEHFRIVPRDKSKENNILSKFEWINRARHTKVSFLSGGQQRFLSVVLTSFLKPKLIIFDEPSAELDSNLRSELKNLISSLRGKYPLIIVEQNSSFVSGLVDKIYYIEDGKMFLKS